MTIRSSDTEPQLDALIVGGGFAGLYMLHLLRKQGLSVRLIEAGSDVGGTWYWNRYPGARCDAMCMDYCYSWDDKLLQEWHWTERYPSQPEILRYLSHVADRFDLRRSIQFDTRITAARYLEGPNRWRVTTSREATIDAQFCIMATGCISVARVPHFPGLEDYKGNTYHSGQWPQEAVDFVGQRVGVIGTGSSGIQIVPMIAEQARHLYVFQRTANFSIPAHNRLLDSDFEQQRKANYAAHHRAARASVTGYTGPANSSPALEATAAERERQYEAAWIQGGSVSMLVAYGDLLTNEEANATAAEFVRSKIRSIVKDPSAAELLCPKDHPIGAKRMCVDTNYYTTFNRSNVSLVDLRNESLLGFTPSGIKTANKEYELDSVILATGFDAMTGALLAIDIQGREGQTLASSWAHGPKTYLGLQVAGFPNLFTVTGPGSPSVLGNVVVSVEQHVEWIAACIEYLGARGLNRIEAQPEAQEKWVAHVNEIASRTLFPKANSWFMGANIPGKPRVFMPYVGGVGKYAEICRNVAANDYEGFTLSAG
jgi:cyclohexanone monooxygenase